MKVVTCEQSDNENDIQNLNSNNSNWTNWNATLFHSVTLLAAESNNGCTINACYNPELAKQLRTRLIPLLYRQT